MKWLNNFYIYISILILLWIYISTKVPIVNFNKHIYFFNWKFINFIVNVFAWTSLLLLVFIVIYFFIRFKRRKYKNKHVFLSMWSFLDLYKDTSSFDTSNNGIIKFILSNKISVISKFDSIIKNYSKLNKNIVLWDNLLLPTYSSLKFYISKFWVKNFSYINFNLWNIKFINLKNDVFLNNINAFLENREIEIDDLYNLLEIYLIWISLIWNLDNKNAILKDRELNYKIIDSVFIKIGNYKNFFNYKNNKDFKTSYFVIYYLFLVTTALEFLIFSNNKNDVDSKLHGYKQKYMYYLYKSMLVIDDIKYEDIIKNKLYREVFHAYNYSLYFAYYLITTNRINKDISYNKIILEHIENNISKSLDSISSALNNRYFSIVMWRYFKWIWYIVVENGISFIKKNKKLNIFNNICNSISWYMSLKIWDFIFYQICVVLDKKCYDSYLLLWNNIIKDDIDKNYWTYKYEDIENNIVYKLHDVIKKMYF